MGEKSPVTIFTFTPAAITSAIASGTAVRMGSIIDTRPSTVRSFSITAMSPALTDPSVPWRIEVISLLVESKESSPTSTDPESSAARPIPNLLAGSIRPGHSRCP